jgi:uncharacterized protein YndB with AHSA1/START domain
MPLSESTVSAVTQALAEASVTAEAQSLSHGTTLLRMGVPLAADAQTVWDHLTQPGLLARWSPIVPDRPLTEMGPAVSRETPEGPAVDARVIEVAPGQVLRHAWGGEGEVLWEITAVPLDESAAAEVGAACVLTVTQTFTRRDLVPPTAAGWHVCLAVLSLLMEGREVERVVGEDAMAVGWEALRDAYERGFAEAD